MFDAGTGGHFIATTMCKNIIDNNIIPVVNSVNEYDTSELYMYCWTAFRQEPVESEFNPSIQLSHAWTPEQLRSSNYQFDNKYIIHGDPMSYLLVSIKKYFKSIDDDAVHKLIENILVELNDIDSIKKFISLSRLEKRDIIYSRKKEIDSILVPFMVENFKLTNTKAFIPVLYEYTAHTSISGTAITVEGFKKYVGNSLCDILKEYRPCKYWPEDYADCKIIKYKDLMIDKTETIPGLDSNSIDQYMQKNFELINRVYSIIDNESAAYIKNFLSETL